MILLFLVLAWNCQTMGCVQIFARGIKEVVRRETPVKSQHEWLCEIMQKIRMLCVRLKRMSQ